MKEHGRALMRRNPSWMFRFYEEEHCADFILSNYGSQVLAMYHRISPEYGAARADLFRYLLMYAVGGVYLDVKSTIVPPIDSIMQQDDEYLLSRWVRDDMPTYAALAHACVPRGKEYQQWFIICKQYHPFLEAVIHRVLANIANDNGSRGKNGVLHLTGPVAYTLAIHPLLNEHKHRWVVANEEGIMYNALSATGESQEHIPLFGNHYSKQTIPIIIP